MMLVQHIESGYLSSAHSHTLSLTHKLSLSRGGDDHGPALREENGKSCKGGNKHLLRNSVGNITSLYIFSRNIIIKIFINV